MPVKPPRRSPTGPLARGPVVVPLDGSDVSERALAYGAALARVWDEQLIIIGVAKARNQGGLAGLAPAVKLEFEQTGVGQAEDYLRRVRDRLRRTVEAGAMVQVGDPAKEVLKAAKKLKARLIVMTTHGRGFFSHAIMGSTTERVVRRAPCPVLVVRDEHKE